MTDTATTTTRTITLTDRPPVKVSEDLWPTIAIGKASNDDSDGRGNRPNRTWTRVIRVRQHADGRAIVSGLYDYDTCFQGAGGAEARRGELLPPAATMAQIIEAIRTVGADLAEAEAGASIDEDRKDSRRWREVVQSCIADLPAEPLDAADVESGGAR